ncbi:hypothetical protein GCM10010103_77850 [Streptomyces paradoxus]|uniref:Uncharacterized protein n=1 Tax=Streptomyces paradoxus TaxID=66375 RepID=A0A7W9TG82_9ACTN|nr:hypothetical protein [Streptomyces paradoxus]MBB6079516.1 hypothetical protein [Streptomyces paradoxus]
MEDDEIAELRLALDLVVCATGDQPQTLGTRSQDDTVTSPPSSRFTA